MIYIKNKPYIRVFLILDNIITTEEGHGATQVVYVKHRSKFLLIPIFYFP